MRKLLTCIAIVCGIYSAQAIKIIHGPYLQAVTDTEATVVWVTDTNALSWVEVAPDDGTHFYYKERPRFYQTRFGKRTIGTLHEVRITGLEPGKQYRYAVASKEVLAQKGPRIHYGNVASTNVYRKGAHTIPTLNPAKEEIEFVVMNDVHSKIDKMEAYLTHCFQKEKTDMVFFNGDMVSDIPNEQVLFDGFLDTAVKHFASNTPFYYVRGNHETRGKGALKFMSYFPTPTAKPYYTINHGNTFFIVLDGGEDKPDSHIEYYETAAYDDYRKEEAEWLKEVVESEACRNAKYRVVLLHMPTILGNKFWHGARHATECFIPILNKANITVMLCGHTHKYSFHNTSETTEAAFPILVNSNSAALKANVTSNCIKIDVVDLEGKVVKSHLFK